jgi:hypothetical protein
MNWTLYQECSMGREQQLDDDPEHRGERFGLSFLNK